MFCSKCGAEIKPNEKFCGKCGTPVKIKMEDDASAANQTSQQQPLQDQPQAGKELGTGMVAGSKMDIKWIIGFIGAIVQILCMFMPRYSLWGITYNAFTSLRLVLVFPFLILSILTAVFFLLHKYNAILITNSICVIYLLYDLISIYMLSMTLATPGISLFLYPVATIAVYVGRSGRKKMKAGATEQNG